MKLALVGLQTGYRLIPKSVNMSFTYKTALTNQINMFHIDLTTTDYINLVCLVTV